MAYYYLKNKKEKIRIADKEFASGGEGILFKIMTKPYAANYVAKIYHPPKRTDKRAEKLQYLIENPPLGMESGAIVWVIDLLYDSKNQFVGFIMPLVRGKKLEILCLGKLPRKISSQWHRFDLKNTKALGYRMRICFNLAAAIYQVHATDNYVLVDMKPDNIIIQPNGIVAIVDMDSVEVIDDNGIAIYPAPVATPEYTPPEFYRGGMGHTVSESWDRFGLAVIFYKLLFGIHPFAATAHAPYDSLVSLHEKIEVGLFANHPNANKSLRIIPPPHRVFDKVVQELQDLFIQCFVDGHEDPNARPTADEWCAALLTAIGDPKLEEHFAVIFGGGESLRKYRLPSSILKDYKTQIYPKAWVEEQLKGATDLPNVPASLRHLQQNGQQELEVKMDVGDYAISVGVLLVAIGVILRVFSGLAEWLMGDFWLSSMWLINLVFFSLIILPVYVFPRISSGLRHYFSPKRRLVELWNDFTNVYPDLRQNVQQFKNKMRTELSQLQVNSNNKIMDPVKDYLKELDIEVKEILDKRKEHYREISQKYMALAQRNKILKVAKGNSLSSMLQNLERTQSAIAQKLAVQVRKEFMQSTAYKSIKNQELLEQKKLKTIEEEELKKYKIKLKAIANVRDFAKTYAKNNSVLIRFFRRNAIFDLEDLEDVDLEGNKLRLKIKYKGTVVIDAKTHKDLKALNKGLLELLPIVRFLKDKKFKNHPVQQAMQPKVTALNTKYNKIIEAAVEDKIAEDSKLLKKELSEAKKLLEKLIEEETTEKEGIEEVYLMAYQAIYAQAEEMMETTSVELDKENEQFKIAVEDILKKNQKTKIALEQQVQKAKEDITVLEKLNNG